MFQGDGGPLGEVRLPWHDCPGWQGVKAKLFTDSGVGMHTMHKKSRKCGHAHQDNHANIMHPLQSKATQISNACDSTEILMNWVCVCVLVWEGWSGEGGVGLEAITKQGKAAKKDKITTKLPVMQYITKE